MPNFHNDHRERTHRDGPSWARLDALLATLPEADDAVATTGCSRPCDARAATRDARRSTVNRNPRSGRRHA